MGSIIIGGRIDLAGDNIAFQVQKPKIPAAVSPPKTSSFEDDLKGINSIYKAAQGSQPVIGNVSVEGLSERFNQETPEFSCVASAIPVLNCIAGDQVASGMCAFTDYLPNMNDQCASFLRSGMTPVVSGASSAVPSVAAKRALQKNTGTASLSSLSIVQSGEAFLRACGAGKEKMPESFSSLLVRFINEITPNKGGLDDE